MSASLVGSEMCIRDSCTCAPCWATDGAPSGGGWAAIAEAAACSVCARACLLYTSDAADDM
eukprot:4645351-Alexandrium_andersonii.AAC.1